MIRLRPRRPITFRFRSELQGSMTCRNTLRGRLRAWAYLLWCGVWPTEVASVLALMKAGTVDAAEDVWQHCEHRGVTVDFALGGT